MAASEELRATLADQTTAKDYHIWFADDGLPADARICPLCHVATLEPLNTDARAG